ncbi:hypothetical protein K9M42_00985 [Patescibacteria group bacterium]|nr:hypothetical protein [Patescibacteria group bacterium]
MEINILFIFSIIFIIGALLDGLNFKLSKKKDYKYCMNFKIIGGFGFLSLFTLIRIFT